jgi:hypothetical protein
MYVIVETKRTIHAAFIGKLVIWNCRLLVISYYSLRELCGVLNVTWQLSREGQHVDPSHDIYIWTLALLTQLINILTVPEDSTSSAETFWECNGVNEILLIYVIALVEILHKIVTSDRGYGQDILLWIDGEEKILDIYICILWTRTMYEVLLCF